jgi:hypothetical protein
MGGRPRFVSESTRGELAHARAEKGGPSKTTEGAKCGTNMSPVPVNSGKSPPEWARGARSELEGNLGGRRPEEGINSTNFRRTGTALPSARDRKRWRMRT